MDVSEADVREGPQFAGDRRDVLEEAQRFLHRHVQDLVNILAAIPDLERLPVVALAPTDIAGDVDVGEKMHFDLDDAVALATGLLQRPPFDVEAEAAGVVAACARLWNGSTELTDGAEKVGVRRGVGARRAADRRLVDIDDVLDLFEPFHLLARRGVGALNRRVDLGGCVAEEGVDDQGRLAGAGDAGYTRQESQRNLRGDVA